VWVDTPFDEIEVLKITGWEINNINKKIGTRVILRKLDLIPNELIELINTFI